MNLTRSEAARVAHWTRTILRHHADATPADLAAGVAWYDRARAAALAMSTDATAHRAAGVIAALSPRCQWSTNVAWAASVLTAADSGADVPNVHTTAMRGVAWRIANGEDPASALKGPKISAFYANIMGDHDRVTVDVWAQRACGKSAVRLDAKGKERAPDGRHYKLVELAYQRAAAAVGLSPRDMQAAVWVHVRGAAE